MAHTHSVIVPHPLQVVTSGLGPGRRAPWPWPVGQVSVAAVGGCDDLEAWRGGTDKGWEVPRLGDVGGDLALRAGGPGRGVLALPVLMAHRPGEDVGELETDAGGSPCG